MHTSGAPMTTSPPSMAHFRWLYEPPRDCRRPFCLRSRRHGGFSHHGVVALLGFSRRDVADRLQQPAIVEPVHPFERCELDGFHGPPRSPPMDNLGLVEAIDRFREGIVVTIANTANRGLNTCFRQALGIFDREVLAASVAVMHEPPTMRRA